MVWIQFVNVKAVRLPVLVKTQTVVELGLQRQPVNVGPDFVCLQMKVIAVQVDSLRVATGVVNKARRIQTGTQPQLHAGRPAIFPQQTKHCEWSCGFITVNTAAQVYMRRELRGVAWFAMERDQVVPVLPAKLFLPPSLLLGGRFDVLQHGPDINSVAVVCAEVLAETLHGERFPQRSAAANQF